MTAGLIVAAVPCGACFILVPVVFALARLFGVYAIVRERECKVYLLFGKVEGTLTEPGLYFLWPKMGLSALIVNLLGTATRWT